MGQVTHLSDCPWPVSVHGWVRTPCEWKLARYLIFSLLCVYPGVYRLDINSLKVNTWNFMPYFSETSNVYLLIYLFI